MAHSPKNDSHLSGKASTGMSEARPPGPVPRRHLGRLGHDIVSNPQGAGKPSTEVKIANSDRKTY